MEEPDQRLALLGYEFPHEDDARAAARELDRRFPREELAGLRIYRVRWNNNFLVEATFPPNIPDSHLANARALLGESGTPVHPDDLSDYKRATQEGGGNLPGWMRRFFGGG